MDFKLEKLTIQMENHKIRRKIKVYFLYKYYYYYYYYFGFKFGEKVGGDVFKKMSKQRLGCEMTCTVSQSSIVFRWSLTSNDSDGEHSSAYLTTDAALSAISSINNE